MLRIAAGLLLVLSVTLAMPVSAQDETALLSGAELGLSEITIAVTDEGWDAPAELAAGRYLVTASYEGERDFGTTAFLLLPDDWTVDDLNEQLATDNMDAEDQPSDGTTVNDVSHTIPDLSWLYELTLAGGVSPVAGGKAQGIIDLTPGNWAIWSDSFSPAAIPLSVTGTAPAVQPILDPSVTVTGTSNEESFAFEIDGDMAGGTQLIQITNESAQPHFVEFVQLSAPASAEQLTAYFNTPEGLAPDPSLGLPPDFQVWLSPFYAATQSPGSTQWIVTSFEPGSYAMVCWLPDPDHGFASHASEGMISTFEVS